ncbi:MAG: YigZ family protein [Bacteroidetes bacterium]|nr:MAG: YigZ family protein [Bacteroidota bacterium]
MMLFEDTYHTITNPSKGLYKEKGSKFIAVAVPVMTEEEVKEKLEDLRKEYHDARHHCYAYVLGFDKSAHRYNDDGEPSGTAGRPIFGQLQSKDLTNILVVVIRYFGGTKLGISGLITAYKSATRDALETAVIISLTVNDVYQLSFEYPLMNEVMRVIKDEALKVADQDFQLSCKLNFKVRKNSSNKVYERFNKIHGVKIDYLKTV